MKGRLERITEEVRKLDPRLYAVRASNGMIQIHREADRNESTRFHQDDAEHQEFLHPRFILALTDTWTLQGKPVDWGLEPIRETLRSMDSWSHDTFGSMVKTRNRIEESKKRSLRNELRARAADLRPEFARATNDINTAGLSKSAN